MTAAFPSHAPPILCIGGAAVDRKFRLAEPPRAATSNPGRGVSSFGGVARNVAENLARLGRRAALISAVGDDADGAALVAHLAALGVDTDGVLRRATDPFDRREQHANEPDDERDEGNHGHRNQSAILHGSTISGSLARCTFHPHLRSAFFHSPAAATATGRGATNTASR